MKILVVGRGVEDARHLLWAHLVVPLEKMGHDVVVFDPVQHLIAGKSDTFDYASDWFFRAHNPEAVCLLPTTTTVDVRIRELAQQYGTRVVDMDMPGMTPGAPVAVSDVLLDAPLHVEEGDRTSQPVIVVADARSSAADHVGALADNFDIAVYGRGWYVHPDLDAVTHGNVPALELSALLRSARVVVALDRPEPDDMSFVSPDAAVIAALALTVGRPCVVPAAMRLDGMPSYTAVESMLQAVAGSLESESALAEVVRNLGRAMADGQAVRTVLAEKFPPALAKVKRDGPKISVFTAAYKIPQYIGQSIESLLDQRAGDLEVLVLDDGSNDETRSVIDKYAGDRRVRVFSQPNIGQTGRFDLIWRTLVPHARGEFIANLDGDDISMPDHFERMLNVFEEDPGVGLVHSAGMGMDSNGVDTGPIFHLGPGYDEISQLRVCMIACPIAHPTVLFRRDMFDRVGTLEEGFSPDYHFWIKSAKYFRFRYLPEILIRYRMHEGSSDRNAWQDQGVRTRQVERARWSMLDFYPALAGSASPRDYAAAHIDLGLRMIRGLVDVDAAFEELDRATALLDGNCPEAEWNKAVIAVATGRSDAMQRLDAMRLRAPHIVASHVANGQVRPYEGMNVARRPFEVPVDQRKSARSWDGTLVTLERIFVVPDPRNPRRLAELVGRYASRTTSSDEIDLCIAAVGRSEQDVQDELKATISSAVDLNRCASITIERVDDPEFVGQDRYIGQVDLATAPPNAFDTVFAQRGR
jgi:hypothetical protein